MTRRAQSRHGAATLLVAGALVPTLAFAGLAKPDFRTPPSDARAREIALAYLEADAAALGATAADFAGTVITDEVRTARNGVTHVYLQQTIDDLRVDGTEFGVHVDRHGRVFHVTGRPLAGLAERAAQASRFPVLAPEEAVDVAARSVGQQPVQALDLVESRGGVERGAVFANEAVSEEPIPVRLAYFRLPESDVVRLAWNLSIKSPTSADWWNFWVDAESGVVLGRHNWTSDATYRVFASPKESPDDGVRTDEVDPHVAGGTDPGTGASPFGWHDLNGTAGADTTLTSGNNVNACVDADANNLCDVGSQPDGGGSLIFQPNLDLSTQQPADYRDAAVVNLYYWNNILHDVFYQYGFDEASGNFQENNYGRGGLASDSVNADAQDGSGTNNANFATPSDGSNPRMQMFVWTAPLGLEINSPAPIAGIYQAGTASFGPQTYNITHNVVLVNDGSGTVTDDGCCNDGNTLCVAPVWPGVAGNIALLRRGQCEFGTKAVNAQNAGALGVILINNQGDGVVAMGPGANGGASLIPMNSVGQSNGNLFVANQAGLNATMDSSQAVGPNRDSDLDNGIIAHEYGHGVSNRLTGGPAQSGCLQNAEQMGEGWSDWMTLFLHADPADTATTSRPIGTYAIFESSATGVGIRRFPYNTDFGVNPFTYADVADTSNSQPHGIGSIWATMLWQMYWELVDVYGFDPDIYNGSGGNNLAFQLSIDGMKLQPCSPGFVDGRDAILEADAVNYEGDNSCDIWEAFAVRGLGFSASQGSSGNRSDGIEAFDLPAECVDLIFADGFGMGSPVRWSAESL
ncbi:MAG: peptidase M36 [Acidobacteriota bacterium]